MAFEKLRINLEVAGVVGAYFAAGIAVWAVVEGQRASRQQYEVMRTQQQIMNAQLSEMKVEQRPWVGMSKITATPLSPGMALKINVTISNSGASPALLQHGYYIVLVEPTKTAAPPPLPECTRCSTAALLAHANRVYSPGLDASQLTRMEVKRIRRGADTILLAGRLDYLDVSGGTHHTFSCAYYRAELRTFTSCNVPDDVD